MIFDFSGPIVLAASAESEDAKEVQRTAQVLLKEPLPLMMQQSIEVFARGTGAVSCLLRSENKHEVQID